MSAYNLQLIVMAVGERFVILVIFVIGETDERSRSTNGVLFRHLIHAISGIVSCLVTLHAHHLMWMWRKNIKPDIISDAL